MTDNTKMREALLKFGDENPSLDLDFRLHTHGKYLTQEKAIVASRAFKAGAAWQAARTVPDVRCKCCGYLVTESEHRGCLRAAEVTVPDGFVMVPIEPTKAMIDAAVASVWSYMLSATPEGKK